MKWEDPAGFVLMEGEEYNRLDPDGFWLMDKYAEQNGVKIGDKLTVTFEDMEFTGTVRGLIEASEYLVCVRDTSQVMPDFDTYGYVYATPAMLRKVIEHRIREEEPDIEDDEMSIAVKKVCDEVFCQVNVTCSLDKEEMQKAVDKALGRSLLISQNLWIAIAGTLLGIPAGIWALNFLMDKLAGEYEMETLVGPSSILPAMILNLGVAVIVGWMISRKNRKINMVEALKI